MSHLHKIVFTFCAMVHGYSLHAAHMQQKSDEQLNEMCSRVEKLGYFYRWQEKDLPQIKDFLAKYGQEIVNFGHSKSGMTLLMHATDKTWSTEGFKEILALPLVDINLGRASTEGWDSDIEVYGQTALMFAAYRLQIEKVKLLLEHNADTTLKSIQGLWGESLYDAKKYASKNCKTREEYALAGEICELISTAYEAYKAQRQHIIQMSISEHAKEQRIDDSSADIVQNVLIGYVNE